MEIDCLLKSHFKRHFMCFCTVMCKDKSKDDMIKDYLNYADCCNFVSNNINNEHWFCDWSIIHNQFTEVVQELTCMQSNDNRKKPKSSLHQLIGIELWDKPTYQNTVNYCNFRTEQSFKPNLNVVRKTHLLNVNVFKKIRMKRELNHKI